MNKEKQDIGLKIKDLWEHIKIPKLTDTQKKEFSEKFNIQAIILFRFTLLIILVAIIPYFILDYYSAPKTYKLMWGFRFIFFLIIPVIGLWLSYKPFIIKHFQFISNTINILFNISILLMIYVSDINEPAFYNYYAGVIVIMSVVIAMRIRLYPSLINFGIILLLYVLIAIFKQHLDYKILSSNLFFILTVILAMIVGNLLLEIYSRKTFLQEELLKIRAKDLENKNNEINNINKELYFQNEEIKSQRDEIIAQRDEIENQKSRLEKIHTQLSESINYATQLQNAILPETQILEQYISDHFIFFRPKDKVSGDFYWWVHVENHTIITVADCTGHGVPGAFMSMLGASLLREIVEKEYITHTGVILRKLRKEIIKTLKQKGEQGEQKDGMDMAIISINHETNVMQFSGANNPLYIIKDKELQINEESANAIKLFDNLKLTTQNSKLLYEIKPDKMPIAIYERMNNFTTHEIQLEKGDQLYLFSDGYADQFGGEKGKKFKYKPFKRLLLENSGKPMAEQKEALKESFEKWKAHYEQIDDVTVLGLKV